MTTLKCDRCDHEAEGETFGDWMEKMKVHYKESHADFMQEMSMLPQEEQMKEMSKWMEENNAKFDAATA